MAEQLTVQQREYGPLLQLINALAGGAQALGLSGRLEAEAILRAARRQTRLSDFGDPHFREPLGRLLIQFFHHYSRVFDFVKGVASVRCGRFLTKEQKRWTKKDPGLRGDRHLFCIEDPFETTHDLGRVMDRDTVRDVREEIDEDVGGARAHSDEPCVGEQSSQASWQQFSISLGAIGSRLSLVTSVIMTEETVKAFNGLLAMSFPHKSMG